jgi:hypothetical protein
MPPFQALLYLGRDFGAFAQTCHILRLVYHSRISVVAMTGAAISIDDAAATDTILSVKERVFAANRELPVRRQRLVYRPGPRGMDALADDETLGGAGVAQDGTAELDVLVGSLPADDVEALGRKVRYLVETLGFDIAAQCELFVWLATVLFLQVF